MEILFKNLAYAATEYQLIDRLVDILHGEEYKRWFPPNGPLAFDVNLRTKEVTSRKSNNRMAGHFGRGILTIANLDAARYFMEQHAPGTARVIRIHGRNLNFNRTLKDPPAGLLQQLNTEVWQHPQQLLEQHTRAETLAGVDIGVKDVQFGWLCRDGALSIEWSSDLWSSLTFEDSQRQMVLKSAIKRPTNRPTRTGPTLFEEIDLSDMLDLMDSIFSPGYHPAIVVKYPRVNLCTVPASYGSVQVPSILFELSAGPSFEREPESQLGFDIKRSRLPFPLDEVPASRRYITRYLRLVVGSYADVASFLRAYELAGNRPPQRLDYISERRELFSDDALTAVSNWSNGLPLSVAVQLEKLLYEMLINPKELLQPVTTTGSLFSRAATISTRTGATRMRG